jgi:hypothetical protein
MSNLFKKEKEEQERVRYLNVVGHAIKNALNLTY